MAYKMGMVFKQKLTLNLNIQVTGVLGKSMVVENKYSRIKLNMLEIGMKIVLTNITK